MTGEQEARHLGVNVKRVKLVVYIGASLLTGLAVSVSGAIGYVGLLVPHVMRMLFGSDYRMLIPASALGGAIAIVVADTLARTVVAPTELPVGAMTAIGGRAGVHLSDAAESCDERDSGKRNVARSADADASIAADPRSRLQSGASELRVFGDGSLGAEIYAWARSVSKRSRANWLRFWARTRAENRRC